MVPGHELVPGRMRHESALEGANGFSHVMERDWALLAGEALVEHLDIVRDSGDRVDQRLLVAHPHLDRIGECNDGLRLDGDGPTVPELGDVGGRVQHAGCVASAALPLRTTGGRAAVYSEVRQNVTAAAGGVPILRESRIVKEQPTERDPIRVLWDGWFHDHLRHSERVGGSGSRP